MTTIDAKLINSIKTPNNDLIDTFAMSPIAPKSLIIKNGVMIVYAAVSGGKSTLLSKLFKIYDDTIEPMIFSFYSGLTVDETSSYHISSYKLKKKPYFIQLPNPEAMVSFFSQFRYKRVKLSEMLLFMKSVFVNDKGLIEVLKLAFSMFNNLSKKFDHEDYMKRVYILISMIVDRVDLSKDIYESDFVFNKYAKKRKIDYKTDPLLFIANVAVSLSKNFKGWTIAMVVDSSASNIKQRIKPIDIEPMLRITKKNKIEMIPSVCAMDDVAQFPLMTTEHPSQFVKDLLAMTRRYQNTFIICAQRFTLINKSLRALAHVFWIGYGLIDADIPEIGKEMPSNILTKDGFIELYHESIKPFTFFVYSNKLGFEVITLKK